MEQVDRIFSSTRKGSGGRSIDTWGDVGLTGDWASKPISIYGRNTISGTYEFFRQTALFSGDYKPEVKLQVGSEARRRGASRATNTRSDIPVSVTRRTASALFRSLCFSERNATTLPLKSVLAGKYPLARHLYIYVNKKPGEAARRAARRVHQIYSVQGRPDADGKRRLLPDHRGNPRGGIAEVGLSTPRNNRLLRASLANKSHSTNLRPASGERGFASEIRSFDDKTNEMLARHCKERLVCDKSN